jgi:hypothetical protein
MGLLEDAIRDHLELKRQHGASDEELLREEADALGPARRDELYADQPEREPNGDGAVAEEELAHKQPAAPAEDESRPGEVPDFLGEAPKREGLGRERRPPPNLDFD